MSIATLSETDLSLLRVQVILAVRAGHCRDVYYSLYTRIGGDLSLASLLETVRL